MEDLFLLLQLLQFSEFLLPEVMFVVEPLVLVVAVNDLGRGGRDDDAAIVCHRTPRIRDDTGG
jgi:hypothetical protein